MPPDDHVDRRDLRAEHLVRARPGMGDRDDDVHLGVQLSDHLPRRSKVIGDVDPFLAGAVRRRFARQQTEDADPDAPHVLDDVRRH